jgi:hypothetical protein
MDTMYRKRSRIRRGCIKRNQSLHDPGMDVQKSVDFRTAPIPALLGANDHDVPRWFILVVALLLDPAAVLLLLAASKRS